MFCREEQGVEEVGLTEEGCIGDSLVLRGAPFPSLGIHCETDPKSIGY